jgi:Flp pilus assembly protein TadG
MKRLRRFAPHTNRLSKRLKTFDKDEKGQSLVEFAIAVPVLLLFLVGIFNFGIIMYTYLNMNITAQEASRLAGLGRSDTEIVQYARDHASLKNPDLLGVNITPDDSTRKPGDYVTVTLKYSLDNLTPIFDQFLSSITLSAKSTVRVE